MTDTLVQNMTQRFSRKDINFEDGLWVFRRTLMGRPITIQGTDPQWVTTEATEHCARILRHANNQGAAILDQQ